MLSTNEASVNGFMANSFYETICIRRKMYI